MKTVYNVIEELQAASHWSMRKLADLAKLKPSTLSTLMKRKSDKISVDILSKLAKVFGVEWYELLTLDPNTHLRLADSSERVYAEVHDYEFNDIIDHALNHPGHIRFANGFGDPVTPPSRQEFQLTSQPDTDEQLFRQSIEVFLGKLNPDGLKEAMRRILEIVNDPRYSKTKEDTLCHEDEPPMAQDYSRANAQTDAGNAGSRSE